MKSGFQPASARCRMRPVAGPRGPNISAFFKCHQIARAARYHPHRPTAGSFSPSGPVLQFTDLPNAAPSLGPPGPSALAALTHLSSLRTCPACARQCPTIHAASVLVDGGTAVSIARGAPVPLRVAGKVECVGITRTLSRPDACPAWPPRGMLVSPRLWVFSRISCTVSSPRRTPGNPTDRISHESARCDSRALSVLRDQAAGLVRSSSGVGQSRGGAPALPVIAGRAPLRASGGSNAAAGV